MNLKAELMLQKVPRGRPTKDEMKAWVDVLERAGYGFEAGYVRDCGNLQVWYETCTKDPDHMMLKHSWHCRRLKYCPDDAHTYANRKAEEALEWLIANIADQVPFRLYLIKLDLTLPHGLDAMPLSEFNDMRNDLLIRYFDKDLIFGGLSVVQPKSTSEPDKDHLHMHNNLLNVALRLEFGRLKVIRLKPYLDQAKLRGLWRDIVNQKLTKRGLQGVPEAVLWVNYLAFPKLNDSKEKQAELKGKIRHRLRYVYRLQVWDAFVQAVRAEGSFVKADYGGLRADMGSPFRVGEAVYVQDKKLGWLVDALFSKRPKASWFGYLSNTKRDKMLKAFTSEPHSMLSIKRYMRWKERQGRGKCSVCGAPLRLATLKEIIKAGYEPPPDGYLRDWGEYKGGRGPYGVGTDVIK